MDLKGYFVLLAATLMIGCSDDGMSPDERVLGTQFFPLEQGFFRTYDIERVDFTLVGSDTLRFQLREIVIDSFLNAENDYTYILNREIRQDSTEEWQLDSVWTARKTERIAVSVENNVSIIKLVFPIGPDGEWDGNSLNARPEETFRYSNTFQPFILEGDTFENTVTVVQSNIADNLIIRDERFEVYAEDIGLVYKDFITLNFCAREDCLGEGIIDGGQVLKLSLIEHGKN